MRLPTILLGFATLLGASASAFAGVIFATGQNNGDPSHASGNFFYAIDTSTGLATPISPLISGPTPAGLAGAPNGSLMGFANGSVVTINPFTGTWVNVAAPGTINVTGFDITPDGRGFGIPFSDSDRRLHQFDLATNAATPIGAPGAIGSALDTYFGEAPGTNQPFIIGLGSVGNGDATTLYGVNLGVGRNQLLSIDPDTGVAAVIGAVNSVETSGPGPGTYSGFAALTGVDENGDGVFDALYGNVNFYDPDGAGPTPSERLGGVARYDLTNGTWNLVGTNPGLIFFGFGSPAVVPEPSSLVLLGLGMGALGVYSRRRLFARRTASSHGTESVA